jgi:hypothetical protein
VRLDLLFFENFAFFASLSSPLTPFNFFLPAQIACLANDTKRVKEAVAAIKMRVKTGHGKSRILGMR